MANPLITEAPDELPVYNWHPSVLARANASAEYLSFLLRDHILASPSDQESLMSWINTHLVTKYLGITDALETELSALASNPLAAPSIFARMVSTRARVGWSTHGHSAVDVNIYSSGGPAVEKLRGNVENTDIGQFLIDYLGVDVDQITKELREKMGIEEKEEEVTVMDKEWEKEDKQVTGGHPVEWLKNVIDL